MTRLPKASFFQHIPDNILLTRINNDVKLIDLGNGRIHSIVERRGKREDKALLGYYKELLEKGTYWVDSTRMKNRMESFEFKWKTDDIIGLQIADLVAYPLTRHILNPNQVNLAFDVIEPNIFQQGGKILGLKVFP